MRRYFVLALILISILTLAAWGFSVFVQPVLAPEFNNSLIALSAALIVVVTVISGYKDAVEIFQSLGGEPLPSLTAAQQKRNRKTMLHKVENYWIKGVLEQSLYSASPIELGMEYRPEAVNFPWGMVVQRPKQEDRFIHKGKNILETFNESGRQLLILGEAGSGKTTLLLNLARELVRLARQDGGQPIPVIIHLSSWATKEKSIFDWLVDELRDKYQVPKNIGSSWLKSNELVLLFDGLDEMKFESGDKCIKEINSFLAENGLVHCAICSRTTSYEERKSRLCVQTAIVLLPLTKEDIDIYLNGVGLESLHVGQIPKYDAELQELAKSPLMLSIMALAYREKSMENLTSVGTIEALRKHILDNYVERMFERRGRSELYPQKQVIRYLRWIAQQMRNNELSIFLVENIQPSWLDNSTDQRRFEICFSIVIAMTVVLVAGLILGFRQGLIFGLSIGIYILAFRKDLEIKTTEVVTFSMPQGRYLIRFLLVKWTVPLTLGLIVVLIGGLTVALGQGNEICTQFGEPIFGLKSGLSCIIISGLFSALISWLLVGLIVVLLSGLIAGLTSGMSSLPLTTRTRPNQGIWLTLKNSVKIFLFAGTLIGLVVGLIIGLYAGLVNALASGVTVGLIKGLVGGLILGLASGLAGGVTFGYLYGLESFTKHFLLRFIFYVRGYIPWNVVHFLNFAAERIFLRKVGGGYIFIHRMLLDYFAELEIDKP